MMRIAVTGGSCSGKTTAVQRARLRDPARIDVVTEVAADLLREQPVCQDGMAAAERRALQLRIHAEQLRRESAARRCDIVLTDRGTLDAAAYWPEGAQDFWRTVGSSQALELQRYDGVIFMEGAPAHFVGDAVRSETAEESSRIATRILAVWADHPRLVRIAACPDFGDKMQQFLRALDAMAPKPHG
ncbi:hypothetical protein SRS16CHR_04359 [Variovorax sp. SRS16]|uniref:ATP/GTP-binding protein n=1 Tax=Variovorax sp. SRS16 TaxID=282217 RepID=UPI001317348A|nr:ATP-binding protein [Variovorax sp. SRS16]VTU28884.1 hypothetical protein SRS16CHR_04359 [Variovorax sp. SRS16]